MGPLVLKLVLLKLYLYVGQDFLFPSKLFFPFKKTADNNNKKNHSLVSRNSCVSYFLLAFSGAFFSLSLKTVERLCVFTDLK